MVRRSPFREKERQELRQLAVHKFDGKWIAPELIGNYELWSYIIRIFLRCIDREKGHYLRFPFSGSEREQPVKTMQVFDFLQQVFIERIHAQIKKMKTKANVNIRRHR